MTPVAQATGVMAVLAATVERDQETVQRALRRAAAAVAVVVPAEHLAQAVRAVVKYRDTYNELIAAIVLDIYSPPSDHSFDTYLRLIKE